MRLLKNVIGVEFDDALVQQEDCAELWPRADKDTRISGGDGDAPTWATSGEG